MVPTPCRRCGIVLTPSERASGTCSSCGAAVGASEPSAVSEPKPAAPAPTGGSIARRIAYVAWIAAMVVLVGLRIERAFFRPQRDREGFEQAMQIREMQEQHPEWFGGQPNPFQNARQEAKSVLAAARKLSEQTKTQQEFGKRFLERIREGNLESAYALLSQELQEKIGRDAFVASIAANPWLTRPGTGTISLDIRTEPNRNFEVLFETGKEGRLEFGVGEVGSNSQLAVTSFRLLKND